jgi:hypothetical protein
MLLGLLFLTWDAAAALPTERDAKAIVNTLNYVRGLDATENTVKIGVVYDGASEASKKSAESVVALFKGGIQGKKLKITAAILDVTAIEHANDVQVFYVTSEMGSHFSKITNVARKNHIASISSDMQCVNARCCMLAIDTSKGMEVYLNEEVLEDLGFDVDAAFRFMVKRI